MSEQVLLAVFQLDEKRGVITKVWHIERHRLDVIGVGYQLARNTNLELTYYMLKPYDKEAATFYKYQNVGYAALSYSF